MKSHDQGDYNIDLPLKNGGQIGICEVIGGRTKQEDAVCYDASMLSLQFSKLDNEEKANVMTATFVSLQSQFNAPELKDKGSCACAATGWIDDTNINLSTSYVGDSVAYMLVLDQANNVKYCAAGNPALHDLANPNEVETIKNGQDRTQDKDVVLGQKRLGGLAVTRALGDTDFDSAGISHKPETTALSFPHEATDKVFMIVVCDGAMEHLKGDNVAQAYAKELASVVQKQLNENNNISPSKIAKSIELNATQQKSGDNISVMVVPLQKGLSPVTAVVFDGHNGNEISQACGRDFNQHFQRILEMKPEQRVQVIDEFDAAFKHNIERSKTVNDKPMSTQDKRNMMMAQRKGVPKLDIPAPPNYKPAPPNYKPAAPVVASPEPAITPRTLLRKLLEALQSNHKLTGPMKLIHNELRDYLDNNKQLDDPVMIARVTDAVTRIIEHKQNYGHLFNRGNDPALNNIRDLMASIKTQQPDINVQKELMDTIVKQVSPRKGFGK